MDSPDGMPFDRHLAQFLLLSYASGDQVTGNWHLTNPDRMVPNIEIVVERIDFEIDGPVSPEYATFTPEGQEAFEERLRTLVLEHFSQGDEIEGTWWVGFSRTDLPEWKVRISSDAEDEIVSEDEEISQFGR